MSSRLENLRQAVSGLYLARREKRAAWADWLHDHHVFVVADFAGMIAERIGANKELAMAAGMLHDIADAVMSRFDSKHKEESDRIARELLLQTGYGPDEIAVIVDDAIQFHACSSGNIPATLEGKAMATGDALGHLKTDFYSFGIHMMKKEKTVEEIKKWGLPKIERDFNDKILFDDIREETRTDYERAKALFTAL